MNEAERNEMLAGYLGDELNEAERASFESMMAGDPELAGEVESLRRTIESMRALDAPGSGLAPGSGRARGTGHAHGVGHAPPKAGVTPSASVARPLRVWAGAVLRYATVIGLAFAAGYFMRGGEAREARPDALTAREAADAGNEIARPVSPEAGEWLQRAAEIYVTRPRGSSFARSLVAIAEAGEEEQ
jgi:hypothetical protein